MAPIVGDLHEEQAHLLLMNQNYRLIKHVLLSKGGLTETMMDIRLIVKHAVLNNSSIIAIVHNHPSQNTRPSKMDDDITKAIQNACKLMRIYLCDHVIVGSHSYFSYREEGKI